MISYLPNPTIERIIPGKFVGEGIKKTPAFEVLIPETEHKKWIDEFWVRSITSGHKDAGKPSGMADAETGM